jgi:hypothetical protein
MLDLREQGGTMGIQTRSGFLLSPETTRGVAAQPTRDLGGFFDPSVTRDEE